MGHGIASARSALGRKPRISAKVCARWSAGLVLAAVLLQAAGAQMSTSPRAHADALDPKKADSVFGAVRAGSCRFAVQRLDAGLATGDPDFHLIAGRLYEAGACVPKDWGRAAAHYITAGGAGLGHAWLRLTAGSLAEVSPPDVGAALWWAHHGGLVGGECAVAAFAPKMDPEAFVAVVQTWRSGLAAACSYLAGVMAEVTSDLRYPQGPAAGFMPHPGEVLLDVKLPGPRFEGAFQRSESSRTRRVSWGADAAAPAREADLLDTVRTATLRAAKRLSAATPTDGIELSVRRELSFVQTN